MAYSETYVSGDELRVGDFVVRYGSGPNRLQLSPCERHILTRADLDRLKGAASWFIIDPKRALTLGAEAPQPSLPLGCESIAGMAEACQVREKTAESAKRLIQEVQETGRIVVASYAETIEEMVENVFAYPAAAKAAMSIQAYDEYTYSHCVNVCAYAVLFGKFLGLDEKALRKLGMSAFFHDVGKVKVPSGILNKPGPLNDDEFKIMRLHTVFGYKLLVESDPKYEPIALGALEHHERCNGMGYPQGLSKERLRMSSRILAVCDAYDAMTSTRVYQKGRRPNEALSILFKLKGSDFSHDHVDRFIKCIGIYPEGSAVRLKNGFTAIVVENHADDLTRPMVRILWGADDAKLAAPVDVDLRLNLDEGRSIEGLVSHPEQC